MTTSPADAQRLRDLSVTEVCFAVGCSSPGSFSTRFTELVGVPPSVYAKGTSASTMLATTDLDATFEHLQGRGVEVVQEPVHQDWGMRDCAVRDPAGNMVRIQEMP